MKFSSETFQVLQSNLSFSMFALLIKLRFHFVKGSKDGLCPLEKLEAVRKKMKSLNELHVIEGGDHSFKIGKKHLSSEGTTQEEAEDRAVQAVAAFVFKVLRGR